MKIDSIEKLFLEELKDLYSAEHQITKALPKMAKSSNSEELRSAFENHLKETHGQIQRLEKIFSLLDKSPRGKTCEGMKGILQEGSELLGDAVQGPVRDAGMISAAQRVEHYEMAAYGAVRAYAELLGQDEIARLLEETLEEEKAADEKLTKVARHVNVQAPRAA